MKPADLEGLLAAASLHLRLLNDDAAVWLLAVQGEVLALPHASSAARPSRRNSLTMTMGPRAAAAIARKDPAPESTPPELPPTMVEFKRGPGLRVESGSVLARSKVSWDPAMTDVPALCHILQDPDARFSWGLKALGTVVLFNLLRAPATSPFVVAAVKRKRALAAVAQAVQAVAAAPPPPGDEVFAGVCVDAATVSLAAYHAVTMLFSLMDDSGDTGGRSAPALVGAAPPMIALPAPKPEAPPPPATPPSPLSSSSEEDRGTPTLSTRRARGYTITGTRVVNDQNAKVPTVKQLGLARVYDSNKPLDRVPTSTKQSRRMSAVMLGSEQAAADGVRTVGFELGRKTWYPARAAKAGAQAPLQVGDGTLLPGDVVGGGAEFLGTLGSVQGRTSRRHSSIGSSALRRGRRRRSTQSGGNQAIVMGLCDVGFGERSGSQRLRARQRMAALLDGDSPPPLVVSPKAAHAARRASLDATRAALGEWHEQIKAREAEEATRLAERRAQEADGAEEERELERMAAEAVAEVEAELLAGGNDAEKARCASRADCDSVEFGGGEGEVG